MESWGNGRRQLLDGIAKIYDQIGANLDTELNRSNVSIPRDELQALQDKAQRAGELEDKLSSALRETRAQLAQEESLHNALLAEAERLNAHLTQELERYKKASPNLMSNDSKSTTASTSSPVCSLHVEHGESKPVSSEMYNSLVKKYNLVFKNWTDIKDIRTKLEKSFRDEKEKVKRYNIFCDKLQDKLKHKRIKIQQLQGNVRALEGRPNMTEVTQEIREGVDPKSSFEGAGRDPPAALSQTQYHGQDAVSDDARRSIDSPVIKNMTAQSNRLEFPARSALHDNDFGGAHHPSIDSKFVNRDHTRSCLTQSSQRAESEPNDLTTILSKESATTEHAGPGPIQPYHSSSTEEDHHSNYPKATGQRFTVKSEPVVDVQSSEDPPVVILERSIKKRNSRSVPTHVPKIKAETISSSPIGLSNFANLESHESIDLDDIGHKQTTPRKHQALMSNLARAVPHSPQSRQNFIQECKSSSLPNNSPKAGHMSRDGCQADSVLPSSSAKPTFPRISTCRPVKRRRVTSDIAVEGLIEDGENLQDMERTPSGDDTPDSDGLLFDLLENPTPPNRTSIPTNHNRNGSTGSTPESASMPYAVYGASRRLSSGTPGNISHPVKLSRNGTTQNSLIPQRRPTENMSKEPAYDPRPKSREGLDWFRGLSEPRLSESVPRVSARLLRPARESLLGETDTSKRPSSTKLDTSATTQNVKSRPPAEHDPNRDEDTENRPLRARPLQKLRLDDFKVNPAYNHGYDFAFTDVVRNHAARRCLQGCTKPECCGTAFRALALAARDPNKPPTASQEESDTRLLKEFMGGNAHRIRHMTKSEREETLLQAKTRDLANKHGKHRQAYERRQSPPGFWRLEFPSTQEEREDRQKGEQLERGLVAQRYDEAMRRGGAYIFRDE